MTWRRAALLLLLPACGGHFETAPHAAPGRAAGEGGAEPGEQTQSSEAGTDDTTSVRSSAGAGGDGEGGRGVGGDAAQSAAGEGGARSTPTPQIASATRYCDNDFYCFGLSCYAPAGLEQHVCVAGCQTNDDCGPGEQCLSSAQLAPGCYATCQTPFDCNYGFDCFDFANQHQSLVCFPTPWAAVWAAKSP